MLLLAILPLVASLALIALAVQSQERQLIAREHALVERAYLDARRSELRNYVALAASTIRPLYDKSGSGSGSSATGGDSSGGNGTGGDGTRGDEAARREQALSLLASFDYGPDGYFFVYDLSGRVLMHSRQPELIGQDLWSLRDPLGRLTIQSLIAQARAGGGFVEYLWRRPSTGRTEAKLGYVIAFERWDWMIGTGLYLDGIHSTLGQLEVQARDNIATTLFLIAGIAALAVALIFAGSLALNLSEHRIAETRLRVLARQVQQSQEDERARIARELHDGISQTLVSTKLLVEAGAETGQGPLLQRALERLNDSLVEIRRISHRLRPALLDTLGLPAALRHLGREVAEAAGIPIEVAIVGTVPALSDEAKTALFRIAQESLTNVARHAGARRVTMTLRFPSDNGDEAGRTMGNGAAVTLVIRDDGRGFDEASLLIDPEKGIGLRNMRERLAAIGGRLSIIARPGQGVRIEAHLPVGRPPRLGTRVATGPGEPR